MNNWTLQSLYLPRSFCQYWCFLYDWAVSSKMPLLPPHHPCPLDHQCCLLLSRGFQIHLWYLEVRQFWKRPNEEFYCVCWTCVCDGDSLDVRGECSSLDFRSSFPLFFFQSADFFVAWLLPNYRNHPLIVTLNSINWFSGVFILLLFFSKTNNKNLMRSICCQDEDNLSYYDLAGTFSTQLSDKEEIFKVTNKREAF